MIILNPQERVRETGESVREMQGEEGFKAGEYQRRLTTTNLRQQMRKHRGRVPLNASFKYFGWSIKPCQGFKVLHNINQK